MLFREDLDEFLLNLINLEYFKDHFNNIVHI
jgi:hypothetical protein